MEPAEKVRIDKWLWAARFFKSRALSRKAVEGGKVHCNGHRIKPSHPVRIGDMLEILQGNSRKTIHIVELGTRRGPAPEAAMLYRETRESILRREQEAERRRALATPARSRGKGRPVKRERRHIIRFTRQSG